MQSSYTLLEERGHDPGVDLLLRRHQRHDTAFPSTSRTTTRGSRTSTRATTGSLNFTVGPAGADGGARRHPRRLAACRGSGTMRSGQPLTVFVQTNRSRSQWNPSLGPGHRPGPSELRAGLRARQRRHSARRRPVVRPGRVRAAAGRHVRQHRPRRLHRPEPAHARPGADEERAAGSSSAATAASSSASRRSTSSTAPTSASPALRGVRRPRPTARRRSRPSAASRRRSPRRGRFSSA